MNICFTVPGVPVAQPRQRHAVIAGHLRNYTPTRHPVNAFKAAAQFAARQVYGEGPPLMGPISVEITAIFPRPKGRIWKTKPMPRTPKVGKPDADNIFKSLADALTGICWRDDSQLTDVTVRKREAGGDEQARTEVKVIW